MDEEDELKFEFDSIVDFESCEKLISLFSDSEAGVTNHEPTSSSSKMSQSNNHEAEDVSWKKRRIVSSVLSTEQAQRCCALPEQLISAQNSSDFEEVERLILENFDENCIVMTPAAPLSLGRHLIVQLYKSKHDILPDGVRVLTDVGISGNEIKCKIYFSGTAVGDNDGKIFDALSDVQSRAELKDIAKAITKSGKNFSISGKWKIVWMFNPELNKIERVTYDLSIIDLCEANLHTSPLCPITVDSFPVAMTNALNAGDMHFFRQLVNKYFDDDCDIWTMSKTENMLTRISKERLGDYIDERNTLFPDHVRSLNSSVAENDLVSYEV